MTDIPFRQRRCTVLLPASVLRADSASVPPGFPCGSRRDAGPAAWFPLRKQKRCRPCRPERHGDAAEAEPGRDFPVHSLSGYSIMIESRRGSYRLHNNIMSICGGPVPRRPDGGSGRGRGADARTTRPYGKTGDELFDAADNRIRLLFCREQRHESDDAGRSFAARGFFPCRGLRKAGRRGYQKDHHRGGFQDAGDARRRG